MTLEVLRLQFRGPLLVPAAGPCTLAVSDPGAWVARGCQNQGCRVLSMAAGSALPAAAKATDGKRLTEYLGIPRAIDGSGLTAGNTEHSVAGGGST